MNDELRQAIAAFVGSCARFAIRTEANRFLARDDLYETRDAMTAAWKRHRP